MSRFLNTRGYQSLAIAVCDRCKLKVPYSVLVSDGNSPGLKVCPPWFRLGCWDVFDPWRLPARQPETISLTHARPDTNIATTDDDESLADVDSPLSPF